MFLSRPLRFDGPANVEIVGPGRLDAEIVGTPKAHVAILGGAAVIDTTEDHDPLHSPRFRLGAGAFLALPKVLRIFPDDFAEPYCEPDPENPKPGDRALRFSTPARSLADQMQLERVQLADAAVVAATPRRRQPRRSRNSSTARPRPRPRASAQKPSRAVSRSTIRRAANTGSARPCSGRGCSGSQPPIYRRGSPPACQPACTRWLRAGPATDFFCGAHPP